MSSLTISLKMMAMQLLPPLVVDWLRPAWRTICGVVPEWEYLPLGWATKDDKINGWAHPTISKTQKAKRVEFLHTTQGTDPHGVAHEAPSPGNDDY